MNGRITPAPRFLGQVYARGAGTGPTGPTAPAALVEIPATFRNKTFRESFLTRILKGDPLPLEEIGAWVESTLANGEGDDSLALLEQVSLNPKAPPHLAYALSLLYGRKGMAAQEYKALVQAQTQARRRPDLVFNLLLTNGRLALLASRQNMEVLLPATLKVTSEPSGAEVVLNGKSSGTTPVELKNLKQGEYRLTLRLAGHKEGNKTLILGLDETAQSEWKLEPLGPPAGTVTPPEQPIVFDLTPAQYRDNLYCFNGDWVTFVLDKNVIPMNDTLIVDSGTGGLASIRNLPVISEVYLTGSFNNWEKQNPRYRLTAHKGTWQVSFLKSDFDPEASYEFKFLVNGEHWIGAGKSFKNAKVQRLSDSPNFVFSAVEKKAPELEPPFFAVYGGAGIIGSIVYMGGAEWKFTNHLSLSFDMSTYYTTPLNFQINWYPFSSGWKLSTGFTLFDSDSSGTTWRVFPILMTGYRIDFNKLYVEIFAGLKPPVYGTVAGLKF